MASRYVMFFLVRPLAVPDRHAQERPDGPNTGPSQVVAKLTPAGHVVPLSRPKPVRGIVPEFVFDRSMACLQTVCIHADRQFR